MFNHLAIRVKVIVVSRAQLPRRPELPRPAFGVQQGGIMQLQEDFNRKEHKERRDKHLWSFFFGIFALFVCNTSESCIFTKTLPRMAQSGKAATKTELATKDHKDHKEKNILSACL